MNQKDRFQSNVGKWCAVIILPFFLWPLAIVNGATSFPTSFPAPTPTLIDLYVKAELVVHAKVVKTETDIGQLSQLKIISVIKSSKEKVPDMVPVCIEFGSHWPIPYEAKSQTVTFLEFDTERKQYVPISSMTGVNVDDESGKFYVRQFAKLPEILREKNARKQLLQKVQWFVEVSMYPASREYGAYGIFFLWSRAKKAELLTKEELQSKSNLLSKSQKEKLCQTLAKEDPDSNASLLVKLLKDYPSGDLDRYLIRSFNRSLMFDKAVPVLGCDVAFEGFEYLPLRLGFDIPIPLRRKYEEFRTRREFYFSEVHYKDGITDSEKADVRDELKRLWRDLANDFLAIPELTKVRSAKSK